METKLFRKLAAVGTGAVALASAFAVGAQTVPASVGSNFFWDASGTKFNIVVGSQAHPLDGVNAAKIAIAAAAKTYKTESKTADCTGGTGGGATCTVDEDSKMVTLAVGETTTTTTDGRNFDADANFVSTSNDWNNVTARNTDTSVLHKETSQEFDANNGTTYNITVEETIAVTADNDFETNSDYHKNGETGLFTRIDSGNITYKIDFGSGLRSFDNLNSSSSDDGEGQIWFLGQQYEILKASGSDQTITLTTNSAKTDLYTGDEAVEFTQGGKTYAIKLVSVQQTSGTSTYTAQMELYNAAGEVIATDNSVDPNSEVNFGGKIDDIVVRDVYQIVGGSNAGKGYAQVQFTGQLLKLEDSDFYNDNFEKDDDGHWQVRIDQVSGNTSRIQAIRVLNQGYSYNQAQPTSSQGGVLYPDDKIELPTGYAIIHYKGFESEESHTVTIGDGKLVYENANESGRLETVQFYGNNSIAVNGTTWSVVDYNNTNNTYRVKPSGESVQTTDLTWLYADTNWANGINDGNSLMSTTAWKSGKTAADNSWDETDIKYRAFYKDPSKVYFFLARADFDVEGLSSGTLSFLGTDVNDASAYTTPAATIDENGAFKANGAPFFVPANLSDVTGLDFANSSPNNDGKYVAEFQVNGGGYGTGQEVRVFIDTYTGDTVDLEEYDGSNDPGVEVRLERVTGYDDANTDLKRNTSSTSSNIQTGWSAKGLKAWIDADHIAYVTLPETAPKAILFIGGTSTSTTGGETLSGGVGDVLTTAAGTKITVTAIDADATLGGSSGGSAGTATYTQTTPLNVGVGVYLDSTPVSGNLVIVGGPLANQMAKGQEGKVSAAGDWTIEYDGASKLYAFGYTKEDTGRAVDAVVSYIRNLA